jgi:hypothetical protein
LIRVKLRASTICRKRWPTGDLEVDADAVTGVEVPDAEGVIRRVVEAGASASVCAGIVVLLVAGVAVVMSAAALDVDVENMVLVELSMAMPDPDKAAVLDFLIR